MPESTRCSSCGSTGQVELQMQNKGGPPMTLLSCSRCENRTWLVDGEPLSREELLAVVSGREDFTLPPKR